MTAKRVFTGDVLGRARELIAEYPESRSAILPLLHLLQDEAGYVTRHGMEEIGEILGITPAEVLGTASFYTMFKLEPTGRHLVSVCTSLSCQILGADTLYRNLLGHYGVANLETTDDGAFTFEEVECAAACGGAPCLQVDYRFFELVDPDDAVSLIEDVRTRGLDAVHAERGSESAPLPPVSAEEAATGPAPMFTASGVAGAGPDGPGEATGG